MTKYFIAALLPMVLVGCAHNNTALQEQITNLEREIVKLRSERANIDAHSSALDDRIVVLKKQLQKCDAATAQKKPSLEVVKLIPEDETGYEVGEPPSTVTHRKEQKKRSDGRPRLVLSGPRQRQSIPMGTPVPSQEKLVASNDFSGLGADNLGVTTPGMTSQGTMNSDPSMALFNGAYRAYTNKQYAEALKKFAQFVQENPTHRYADNALFWRGECYLAGGQMLRAIGEFERLASRYPQSDKVASGLYRIGFVYDRLRDFAKASEYYFKVVERFPGTDAARRASRRVAEIKNSPTGGRLIPTSAKR